MEELENDVNIEDNALVDNVMQKETENEEISFNDSISNHDDVPERVQQDMQFLKDSWANIIDNDDAENNLLEELEKDDHIEAPFQVVQSKKKAKNQKNNTSKSSYSTRSKAGTSKPFR